MSPGWSYVFDYGGLIVLSFSIFLIYLLRKYGFGKMLRKIKIWVKNNAAQIVILFLSLLIIRWYVFDYYFFSEDVYSILRPINNGGLNFPSWYMIRGYPFLPFIFSFLTFGTNAFLYNLLSILLLYLAGINIYLMVKLLTKNKIIGLMSGLFFLTTPSYLDAFSWQATIQGSLLVLNLSLLSIIFVILYRKNSNKFFLFMSLLFFASLLKVGFIRSAGMFFVIEYMLLFFLKNKTKFLTRIFEGSLYMLIWSGFIFTNFSYISSYPFFSANHVFISYNEALTNFISPFFYYTAKLFVPYQIAKDTIPSYKIFFPSAQSSIWVFGEIITIVLLILAIVSFINRKKMFGKILLLAFSFFIFNIFYVPLFGNVPGIDSFDRVFVMRVPPYGPGSRYVLFSSVGIGIILSTLFYYFLRHKNIFLKIVSFFIFIYFVLNALCAIDSHKTIVKSISIPDGIFIGSLFRMIPRDGQPKLVFSTNPKKNAIDANVGGRSWLYGFYKEKELFYTKDKEEFVNLSSHYGRKNTFAFYNNPETNSFKNISDEVYSELVGKNYKKKDYVLDLAFNPSNIVKLKTSNGTLNKFNRAFLESKDLNYRILFKKEFIADLAFERTQVDSLPYSDFVIGGNKFPSILWRLATDNFPTAFSDKYPILDEFTLGSLDNVSIKSFSFLKKNEILNILNRRDNLNKNMTISVSGKKDDLRVDEKSLIDGLYSSEPYPSDNQKFYLTENSPVTIDMEFPYPITLGRILLNTPKGYVSDYSPKTLRIMSSSDGLSYEDVGSMDDQVDSVWSPNNGKMTHINLMPVNSKYLKLIIEARKGGPIMLDEIVVDEQAALKFSPQQIIDYRNNAFLYVDDQDLLNNLISVGYYSKLSFIYACAEDDDWHKQKKDFSVLLPGVWKTESFDLSKDKIILPIDCNGSVLRKIIIFGPPYPARMQINSAILR